jgi:hypothetical protein
MELLDFSLSEPSQLHYGSGVDSASNRNDYQISLPGGKGGRCVELTAFTTVTYGLSSNSGSLKPLEPWPCRGLYRDSFLSSSNRKQPPFACLFTVCKYFPLSFDTVSTVQTSYVSGMVAGTSCLLALRNWDRTFEFYSRQVIFTHL